MQLRLCNEKLSYRILKHLKGLQCISASAVILQLNRAAISRTTRMMIREMIIKKKKNNAKLLKLQIHAA